MEIHELISDQCPADLMLKDWTSYYEAVMDTLDFSCLHLQESSLLESFIRGCAMIRLFPITETKEYFSSWNLSVQESIYRDWCMVGKDLSEAIYTTRNIKNLRVENWLPAQNNQPPTHN